VLRKLCGAMATSGHTVNTLFAQLSEQVDVNSAQDSVYTERPRCEFFVIGFIDYPRFNSESEKYAGDLHICIRLSGSMV